MPCVLTTPSLSCNVPAYQLCDRAPVQPCNLPIVDFSGITMKNLLLILLIMTLSSFAASQPNRIDIVLPDSPELAAFGQHVVGVRTLEVSEAERLDILNARPEVETPRYLRELTLEIWYPAEAEGHQPGTSYPTPTRNPEIQATLHGRAMRDAPPTQGQRFPLVIVSHGYPGNRYLLSHLGENLASKGYVVASIDHRDSTYDDQQAFSSTLYNRPLDQRQTLAALDELSQQAGHFLHELVDANNTALIGYSMGGYGVLNNLGAGFSEAGVNFIGSPPNQILQSLAAASTDYAATLDPRIKVGIPIAPWGMNMGFWDAAGLAELNLPMLVVAGDADPTSGYEQGVQAIYNQAASTDRYMLVFKNAGHNIAAPIPLPVEFLDRDAVAGASHYQDPVWSSTRANNILQHFVTAFLDLHLKADASRRDYLNVTEDGAATGETPWKGFAERTTVGLKMYRN